MKQNETTTSDPLSIFREVMQRLIEGVDRSELEREFRAKFVSPGITVRRFVEEMIISGGVKQDGKLVKLTRRPTNPTVPKNPDRVLHPVG